MASTTTSLNCYNFAGIRSKEANFSEEIITCSDCQNIELYYTGLNSGVGIRTAKGNVSVSTNIEGTVYGLFEATLGGVKHIIVYTEIKNEDTEETKGYLYYGNDLQDLIKVEYEFQSTKKACGTTYAQGWSDIFVFSNGKNICYIEYDNNENIYSTSFGGIGVEDIIIYKKNGEEIDEADLPSNVNWVSDTSANRQYRYNDASGDSYTKTYVTPLLVSTEGEEVFEERFDTLGCVNFDNRIWLFKNNTLFYSKVQDCKDFSCQASLTTDSGYIVLPKTITAIANYLGSLAVFYNDSSTLVAIENNSENVSYAVEEDSPGGCASYNSLVFHGTELYFFDKTKNSIFSFSQVVNGDKTLSDNIAADVVDIIEQADISSLKTLSVVQGDRNEIWFLLNTDKEKSTILIYDYLRKEFLKRVEQSINALTIFNNKIYSASDKVFLEYSTDTFDGKFIEAYYQCSTFNMGTDNTLKITKFPPRLAIDGDYNCYFELMYVKNYDKVKKAKEKEYEVKTQSSISRFGEAVFGVSRFVIKKPNGTLKLPTTTFKALDIRFSTKDVENKPKEFAFKALEFSKLKVKNI